MPSCESLMKDVNIDKLFYRESTGDYPPPPPPLLPLSMLEARAANTPSRSSFLADEIPDGVDPSFLAALPEEMRAEVISEHLR